MANPLNLKELRKLKNLTQKQVGDAVGLTSASISRYESEGTLPLGEPLDKLIDLFGLDYNEVMQTVAAQSAASEPSAKYETASGTHPLLEQYRVLIDAQGKVVEAQARTIEHLNGVIEQLSNSISLNSSQK